MFKNRFAVYNVLGSLALFLTCLSPAWAGDTRTDLQSWLQSDSRNWLSTYVWDSIRNISVLYRTDTAIVLSARYDYRLGDSTFSDTAYFGFSNEQLYCLAYASEGNTCTLYGKEKN